MEMNISDGCNFWWITKAKCGCKVEFSFRTSQGEFGQNWISLTRCSVGGKITNDLV